MTGKIEEPLQHVEGLTCQCCVAIVAPLVEVLYKLMLGEERRKSAVQTLEVRRNVSNPWILKAGAIVQSR